MQSQDQTKELPINIDITINGQKVTMEVDTGAATSVPESLFSKLWPRRALEHTKIRLRLYTKEEILVIGCLRSDMKVR